MLSFNDIAAFHDGYVVANDRKFREIVDYVRRGLEHGRSMIVQDADPQQCERIAELCAPCQLSVSLRNPRQITIMPLCAQATEQDANEKKLFVSGNSAAERPQDERAGFAVGKSWGLNQLFSIFSWLQSSRRPGA